MSKKHVQSDDNDEDVDFDFFDDPPEKNNKESSATKQYCEYNDDSSESESDSRSAKISKKSHSQSPTHSHSHTSIAGSENGSKSRGSVRRIEAKLPVHRTSNEYSDNFDSDSDGSDKFDNSHSESQPEKLKEHNKKQLKTSESDGESKQAWGKVERNGSSNKGKSKSTASRKSDSDRHRRKSYESDKTLSDDSSDFTTTDSDSDVTDVSPLNSPGTMSKLKRMRDMYDMHELAKIGKPPRSPMHKETVSYRKPGSRPISAKSDGGKLDKLLNANSDQMDLKILMQAVLEMEKEREVRQRQQRRVLFTPPVPKQQPKLNQTFSNDRVRTIDKENQRLMSKIMNCAKEAETTKQKRKVKLKQPKEPPKITPSAVNRMKDQRRIEQENFAMLKRLQHTKATKDLRRDHLMTDYNTQMLAGHSVAAVHCSAQQRRLRSPYSTASDSASIASGSVASGTRRSRPGSAKSGISATSSTASSKVRPHGDKHRPQWEAGW